MSTAQKVAGDAKRGSEELQKLKRGELSLDDYLESRVEIAIVHVKGLLSDEELDFVREIVRDEMKTDPTFRELIRRTTGQDPGQSRG